MKNKSTQWGIGALNGIGRDDNGKNRLTMVYKHQRIYSLWHPKNDLEIKIRRTKKLDIAFDNEIWAVFEEAEARAIAKNSSEIAP
jgi:hypothetical protein